MHAINTSFDWRLPLQSPAAIGTAHTVTIALHRFFIEPNAVNQQVATAALQAHLAEILPCEDHYFSYPSPVKNNI